MANSQAESADFLAPPAKSLHVEHLCDVVLPFTIQPQVFETPLGTREIIVADEGTVIGPRLRGSIWPGYHIDGLWSSDGVGQGPASGIIHTEDGADILMTAAGKLPPSGREPQQVAHTEEHKTWMNGWATTFFETGAAKYMWLNSTVAVMQVGFIRSEYFLRIFRLP
ncbi:MAG: DUF3237 family protein [Corynebacteriales bacterium]|nr:DUF3237 family protein [Mycobacteriales bacterium]